MICMEVVQISKKQVRIPLVFNLANEEHKRVYDHIKDKANKTAYIRDAIENYENPEDLKVYIERRICQSEDYVLNDLKNELGNQRKEILKEIKVLLDSKSDAKENQTSKSSFGYDEEVLRSMF